MNITQKLYNKIHLTSVLALILIFLYTVYFDTVFSHKKLFLCISTSSLSCVQRLFFKMKLVKNSIPTQLKQTNLENPLHISRESPKEGFNDTIFQHFMDETKHCNPDMRTDLQLVPVFLCLYSIYLVVILSFRMIFFHNVFCFFFSS